MKLFRHLRKYRRSNIKVTLLIKLTDVCDLKVLVKSETSVLIPFIIRDTFYITLHHSNTNFSYSTEVDLLINSQLKDCRIDQCEILGVSNVLNHQTRFLYKMFRTLVIEPEKIVRHFENVTCQYRVHVFSRELLE